MVNATIIKEDGKPHRVKLSDTGEVMWLETPTCMMHGTRVVVSKVSDNLVKTNREGWNDTNK